MGQNATEAYIQLMVAMYSSRLYFAARRRITHLLHKIQHALAPTLLTINPNLEISSVLDQILEDRRVELVVNRLAFALCDDQAAGTKDREVPRDRGPARLKLIGDLAGRARARAEDVEDASTGVVGQRAEDRGRRLSLYFHG